MVRRLGCIPVVLVALAGCSKVVTWAASSQSATSDPPVQTSSQAASTPPPKLVVGRL